jgi:hypothetical protein
LPSKGRDPESFAVLTLPRRDQVDDRRDIFGAIAFFGFDQGFVVYSRDLHDVTPKPQRQPATQVILNRFAFFFMKSTWAQSTQVIHQQSGPKPAQVLASTKWN